MKITLNYERGECLVVREEGDPRPSGIKGGKGESYLLHLIKKALNGMADPEGRRFDFIKKRMWKDGHLVNDFQQYLRERKPVDGRVLAVWSGFNALRGADQDFRGGRVVLEMEDIGTQEKGTVRVE